jgi:phosphoesterase RecJ-like protein
VSGAVAQALERAGRVVVFSHYDPDGDALGASLGLMHLLKLQGKTVWVHSAGPIPEEYGFLPGVELVSQDFPPAGDVDLAVLLDCHQPQRAGQAEAEYLSKVASAAVWTITKVRWISAIPLGWTPAMPPPARCWRQWPSRLVGK